MLDALQKYNKDATPKLRGLMVVHVHNESSISSSAGILESSCVLEQK